MIKEYNKQPRSQASGPVSIKEVLNNCKLPFNKVNVSVKVLPENKRRKYTPEQTTVIKKKRQKKAREEKEISPISFKEMIVNPEEVILGLAKKERAIFELLYSFRNKGGLSRQRRSVIAEIAQCTVGYVSRVTRKFVELGLLCKSSKTCWDSVQYVINPKLIRGPLSFSLWFNLLGKKDQNLWMDHEMLPGGYISKSIPKERIIPNKTYWKKREEEIKKFKEEKRKVEEQKNRKERENYSNSSNRVKDTHNISDNIKESYLSKNLEGCENVDKYFVSGRSKYPVSRDEEMSRKTLNFNDIGFSSVMSHISSFYELNVSKRLKLFAFPISCLESVFQNMESYVSPKRGGDRFFLKCQAYCEQHRMKPDWNRYTSLCKEYGIPKDITSSSNSKSGMYNTHVPQEEESLAYLIQERVSWKLRIHEAEGKPDPLCMIGVARSRLAMVEEELAERIDNGETIH